jgi:hypothetical protein
MFFMGLCVSQFHSFTRIKFCGGKEIGFDAFDGGFYGRIEGCLVGEGAGAVIFGFEGLEFGEGSTVQRLGASWGGDVLERGGFCGWNVRLGSAC